MLDKIIIDADLCIKLGGSNKYRYLYDVLPMISKDIYAYTRTWRGDDTNQCGESVKRFDFRRKGNPCE